MNLLEMNHIKKSFGNLEVLKDISLTVNEGEVLSIIGPSGSGKSTLAKLIMGIEKSTSGEIYLDDKNITDFSIDERANAGIGFAFQQPPRFKGMTIRRFLSLSAGKELKEDKCCEILSTVGLCAREYVNRQVDATLSGGEMKRLEIASAMAKNHSICIYDEPEAGIDLWSFNMLIESFKNISAKQKQSMIIISHQERILNIADKIIVVSGGTIKSVGKKDEVLPDLLGTADAGCKVLTDKLEGRK